MPENSDYSPIFERLVASDDDLIGLIAYALYKQKKRNWIIGFKERESHKPSEDEIKVIQDFHEQDSELQGLRNLATDLLVSYSDSVLISQTPEIERQAVEKEALRLVENTLTDIKKQNEPLKTIGLCVLSSLLFSLLLVLFGLILHVDWGQIAQAIGITAQQAPHPPR